MPRRLLTGARTYAGKCAYGALVLAGVACFVSGCELFNTEDDIVDYGNIGTVRYSAHVQRILNDKCVSCHGADSAKAGLRLDDWTSLMVGAEQGEAVVPFDASNSRMIEMVTQLAGGPHPLDVGEEALTSDEIQLLRRWITEGAQNDDGDVPYSDSDRLLYVCNQNDAVVSVIDTDANVVVRNIHLQDYGFSSSAKPHHVQVEPDGTHWYVSLIGDNTVAKFTRENVLVGQVAFETPGMLAVHPTNDLLYVGRSLSATNPPSSVGKINRSDMTLTEIPVLFPRPHALVISPAGDYVFSGSLGQNQLITISTTTDEVSFTPVAGPQHAYVQHAVSPFRQLMFTSAQLTNELLVFDVSDPTNISLVDQLAVEDAPWHPVYGATGDRVYVGSNRANTVVVVLADALLVTDIIEGDGLAQPHGSAVSHDGRHVYITNRNTDGSYTPRHDFGDNTQSGATDGTVVVVEAATNLIVKVLELGTLPAGAHARP